MTVADGPLARAREWSVVLAAALDEVGDQLDAAARRLGEGWPDAGGREWLDRLRLLRRAVVRDADDAHDLGRTVDGLTDDGTAPGAVGPQLGSTAARRADDRRGVTIPRLGDDPGG